MKKIGLLMLFFGASTAFAQPREDLATRERELLSEVKNGATSGVTLAELARVRERRGLYDRALATWDLIKKKHPNEQAPNQSSAPNRSWGEIANFWMHRLRRKQNQAARKPQPPTSTERNRIARVSDAKFLEREGQIELSVQADLDGDFVDEVFFAGKYGPLGQRDEPFMGIAKLRGNSYEVVWRATGKNKPTIFPFAYQIADFDGDGWKEIQLGFEPNTGNAATLTFNGRDAMMLWAV